MIAKRDFKKMADERIKFAVDLAQLNVKNLREGDVLNLQDDFKTFICGLHDGWTETPEALQDGLYFADDDDFRGLDRKFFEDLKTEIEKFLSGVLLPQKAANNMIVINGLGIGVYSIKNTIPQLSFAGDLKALFFYRLLQSLRNGDLTRFLKCPVCGRIFYRVGKKEYCSMKCTYKAMKMK